MSTRIIRNQPFCWQEKKVLRLLQSSFEGMERAKMITLYTAITWMESDFNNREILYFTKGISTYSGLSKEWIPQGLRNLEKLGIVVISENRQKDGRHMGKTLAFTPENITEMPPKAVSRKAVNRRGVNRSPDTIEDSNDIEDSTDKEKNNVIGCPAAPDGQNPEAVILEGPQRNAAEESTKQQTPDVLVPDSLPSLSGSPAPDGKRKRRKDCPERTSEESKQIVEILGVYKKLNPLINFARPDYRNAAAALIGEFGFFRAMDMTLIAVSIQGKDIYTPQITNPVEMNNKLGALKVYFDKELPKLKQKREFEKSQQYLRDEIAARDERERQRQERLRQEKLRREEGTN